MATYKLTVSFTGLCGFVPVYPTYPPQRNNELFVLMPGLEGQGHHVAPEERHVPVLVIRIPKAEIGKGYVTVTGRQEADIVFYDSGGDQFSLYDIENLDINVHKVVPKRWDAVVKDGLVGYCPLKAVNDDYFSWVARVGKISEHLGRVDVRCLSSDTAEVPRAVGSRVLITSGEVKVNAYFVGNSQPFIFKFKPKGDSVLSQHAQALAEEVLWDINDDTSPLTLTASSLYDGKAPFSVVFKAPVTQVYIKNLPLADVLGTRTREPIRPYAHRKGDEHFDSLYRFCAADPGMGKGPIPFATVECVYTGNISNPRCPPAAFSPIL
jgi:hypothetical protein